MSLKRNAIVISLFLVVFARPTFAIEKYALLIGVNKCPGFKTLDYAERDVTELAKQLLVIGYAAANIILMTEEKADAVNNKLLEPTQRNFYEQLKRFADPNQLPIGKDDHVLVALSGHGVQINGKSYFCPSDSAIDAGGNTGDPLTRKRLIAMSDLQLELKKIPASVKLLLCDACRETVAAPKQEGKAFPLGAAIAFNPEHLKDRAKGFVGFFSCQPGQQAYENPDIKHSWFFYHLINGLRGEADQNHDGQIFLEDLVLYVKLNVNKDLRVRQLEQMPDPIGRINFLDPIVDGLVSWSPADIWKETKWEPKGEIKIVLVGRDEKRFYSEIVRTVSIPDADKPIEISFLLIDRPNQPFYMMKNKVSRELFHCFAHQNPDKLHRDDELHDEDSPWLKWIDASEATDPQLPAFEVTFFEAQAFAKWLGGAIPTEKQWDSAAGLDDWINDQRMPADASPYQPPIGRPLDIALGPAPRPVGSAKDDYSRWLVRDMAGNGKEWTSAMLNGWHILRGHSYEQDRPVTFKQIESTSAGIRLPHEDSAYTTFRVVLDPLK